MDPIPEFVQLQLDFTEPIRRRYEVIRPLVLFTEGTATQRAQDTDLHPDTVRRLLHDFRNTACEGCYLPSSRRAAAGPHCVGGRTPGIDRLKVLYGGFHARELA